MRPYLSFLFCVCPRCIVVLQPVSVLVLAVLAGGLYLWYSQDSSAFSGLFSDIMNQLSVFDRFDSFVDGVFDLSVTGVFLFLSVQALEKRRWSE